MYDTANKNKGCGHVHDARVPLVDGTHYEFVTRVNGKVTTTTRVVHASDGKTRTITTTGTNEQGQKVNNVVVWEKRAGDQSRHSVGELGT